MKEQNALTQIIRKRDITLLNTIAVVAIKKLEKSNKQDERSVKMVLPLGELTTCPYMDKSSHQLL